MQTITIASGLKHFHPLSRIVRWSDSLIETEVRFAQAPLWLGLEAMAQSAGMHLRRRFGFDRHVFLLTVERAEWSAASRPNGLHCINAEMTDHSDRTFRYDARMTGASVPAASCELLMGTATYDHRFAQSRLKAFYRRLFDRLCA